MPALLLPAALPALAALLALAIPLLVHLARRSEAIPVDFAALRWLREKPRPRALLRFDEGLLLAVRLLLLALLALWLARPVLTDSADMTPVVAVLPGVADAPPATAGTRGLWLAPGFGSLDTPPPPFSGSVTSLVRQLDSELAPGVPLRIVLPPILQGVDAERPRLSRPVTWQIVPDTQRAAQSATQPGTQLATRPAATPTPYLSLRQSAGADRGLRYLRAAAAAWTPPGRPPAFDTNAFGTNAFDTAPPDAPLPSPPRVLVWLTPGPLPAAVRDWITAGGTALTGHATPAEPGPVIIPWRDAVGAPLVAAQTLGQGRLLRFTRPLTPAAIPDLLEADFPHALAALLTPPPPAPSRVATRDLQPLTGARPWPQPARDLQPWLALALALLFVAERWLATRRSRAVAP